MLLFIPIGLVLLSMLVTYFAYKHLSEHSNTNSTFIQWLSLNPKKGLSYQPLLWLCILVPILHFFAFGYFAWRNYTIEFSVSGFNTFLEISKLPLGILALSLPCAALAIRIHATHQTALQITVTEFKNKQDAYYAHEKYLHDSFSRLPEMVPLGFKSSFKFPVDNRLYVKLFPTSSTSKGVGMVDTKFLNSLEEKIIELGVLIYYINTYSSQVQDLTPIANIASRVFGKMQGICFDLYIDLPMSASADKWIKTGGGSNQMRSENVDQMVGQFRYLYKYIVNLHAFSGLKMEKRDSRMTHIIEHPMYMMIRRTDKVAELYKVCEQVNFKSVDFEIPPD